MMISLHRTLPALLSALTAFTPALASVQGPPESASNDASPARRIEFAPPLEAGDAIDLVLFRGLEQSRAGRTLIDGGLRVPVHVEVVGRSASGLRVRWSLGSTELVRGERRLDLSIETLAPLLDGLSLDFEADREGRLLGWTDAIRLRRDLESRRDELLDARREAGASKDEVDAYRRQLEHQIRPQALERLLLEDPARYHAIGHGAWIVGRAEEADARLVNPFGEPAFPARERTVLSRLPAADGTGGFTLERRRQLVDEHVTETLLECFRRKEHRVGATAAQADQLPEVDVLEVERTAFAPESLWPTSVRFERRVEMTESVQVDRVEILRAPQATDSAEGR